MENNMTDDIQASTGVKKENYWETVLLYFAAFLVGMGIVSLVAANWQQIPNGVKLGGAVLVMLANAGAIIFSHHKGKSLITQILAVIYAFLLMGVLGLISQIFQLPANVSRGCLIWSLLSWPLFLVAPRLLWMWVPLFFFGVHYLPAVVDNAVGSAVFGEWNVATNSWEQNPIGAVWYKFISVFCAYAFLLIYELWVNFKPAEKIAVKPLRVYSGLILWNLFCQAAYYALHADKEAFGAVHEVIVPCLLLAALVWALNRYRQRTTFMPIFLLGAVIEYGYVWLNTWMKTPEYAFYNAFWRIHSTETFLPLLFVALMLIYALWRKMPRLQKLSIAALFIWFVSTYADHVFDLTPCLIVCALLAVYAYKVRSKRKFNVAVVLAVLRILGAYADTENLQYMGIYLIGAGLLLIATILLLNKYSHLLWEKADEK